MKEWICFVMDLLEILLWFAGGLLFLIALYALRIWILV
jgi:hypothetical protein